MRTKQRTARRTRLGKQQPVGDKQHFALEGEHPLGKLGCPLGSAGKITSTCRVVILVLVWQARKA